ncbi:MAG: hypothetical protein ACLU24_04615 [Candidatus Pseudoruminococcus sp.]
MKIFLKSSNYYSKKYQNSLIKSAEKSQKSSNPYTWRFKVIQGDTLESFDAIFDRCGMAYDESAWNTGSYTGSMQI